MFRQFAERHGGIVAELVWCRDENGVIRPSCEGHGIVVVPVSQYRQAQKEADQLNEALKNFGEVVVMTYRP